MSLLEMLGETFILKPLEALGDVLEKANKKWDDFEDKVDEWEDKFVDKVGEKIDAVNDYVYGSDDGKEHANAFERSLFENVIHPGVDKVLGGIAGAAEKADDWIQKNAPGDLFEPKNKSEQMAAAKRDLKNLERTLKRNQKQQEYFAKVAKDLPHVEFSEEA